MISFENLSRINEERLCGPLWVFDGNWSLGRRPDTKTFTSGLLFCMCVAIKNNEFTMSTGPSLPTLFVPEWTITNFKLSGKNIFMTLQSTCYVLSPLMLKFSVW